MSWRLLFFSLLVFAGIATALGLRIGDWLIDHVPNQATVHNASVIDPEPQLDANGRPMRLQPQQPLIDGTQGVPQRTTFIDWKIKADSLNDTKHNEQQAVKNRETNPMLTPVVTQGSASGQTQIISPITTRNNNTSVSSNTAWESEFHSRMATCRTMGFDERPACIRQVRSQYCGANNAWGKVSDCPAR